jgi:glycosyltransferase involved in cell wall biosynthesis
LKSAVVYETLADRGGGERATLVLARAFQADVYTTNYNPESAYPEYELLRVIPSSLISLKHQYPGRVLRLIQGGLIRTEAMFKFRKMDLSAYDLVITVGHAKHVPVCPGGSRIHYELTPTYRYRFEPWVKPWSEYMKLQDRRAMARIKHLACNSENTRAKIKHFYGRDAEVIYPAVNVNKFRAGKSDDYFLAVERISEGKNIEAQLEVFRAVPDERLLIVGSPKQSQFDYLNKLKAIAPSNVIFLGRVSDPDLIDLYSHAKATIQTNLDEDLGRIPIESMASGKPCIAVNSGGFKETIINGETGILVEPPYIDNLSRIVSSFNNADFDPEACRRRAMLFSEEAHIAKMKKLVSLALA